MKNKNVYGFIIFAIVMFGIWGVFDTKLFWQHPNLSTTTLVGDFWEFEIVQVNDEGEVIYTYLDVDKKDMKGIQEDFNRCMKNTVTSDGMNLIMDDIKLRIITSKRKYEWAIAWDDGIVAFRKTDSRELRKALAEYGLDYTVKDK